MIEVETERERRRERDKGDDGYIRVQTEGRNHMVLSTRKVDDSYHLGIGIMGHT